MNIWILDYSSDSMQICLNFKMCFLCHRLISSYYSTATLFGYQSCQGPEPFICVDSWVCSWFVLYWWTHSRGCVVNTQTWGLEAFCFNWSGLPAVLSELWWIFKVNLSLESVYYIFINVTCMKLIVARHILCLRILYSQTPLSVGPDMPRLVILS